MGAPTSPGPAAVSGPTTTAVADGSSGSGPNPGQSRETSSSDVGVPENSKYGAYLSGATASAPSTAGDGDENEKKERGTSDGSLRDEPSGPDDYIEYPTGVTFLFIVVALILSIFLVSLDMTIVATAIPRITDEFQGLEDVAWYGSAFFMTVGGFQSTWGKIFKYFPLKISFLVSVFIFELGSLICGVAPNSAALIIGRVIAGIGAAGIGSGAYTIVAFTAEPKKRPVFTGIIGTSYGIAAVVGPLIGGAFSDHITWRWCFYINLPIGGLSAVIITFLFRAPSGARPAEAPLREKLLQMDLLGTALVMGGVVAYILALQYGGQTLRWGHPTVIGLLVGFVLIFAAFCAWERFNGERSMIVPRLFGQREVWVGSVYAFLFGGSYFIVIYYLPIYFQSIDDSSPTESGVRNLPLILSVTAAPRSVFQTVGGAFWVSAAQSAFVNELVARLASSAPDVDPLVLLGTGATQIRTVFPAELVPGILVAYMAGIQTALALAVGAVGVAFVVSLFSNFRRLNTETLKMAGGAA